MKKLILFLALFATQGFAVDRIISAPSGNLVLNAKSGSKIVIEKEIESKIQSPGFVPIGGMVAVMPNIQGTDAWQPPATGVIKDGFMRADGHTITAQNVADGSKLRAGTVLPNMTGGKYPRGNTTSGTTGGANTVTLAANQIPQLSGTFTSGNQSADHTHTGTTGGHSADHSHSGTTGTVSSDHVHGGSTSGVSVNHVHSIGYRTISSAKPPYDDGYTFKGIDHTAGNTGVYSTSGFSADHSHSFTTGGISANHNHGFSTGGVSANHTHSFTSNGVSANHTHSTGVTLGYASPSAVNNEPAYVETVWVIRVK